MSLKSFDLGVIQPPVFADEDKERFERLAQELRELMMKHPPATFYRPPSQAQREHLERYLPTDFFSCRKEEHEKTRMVLTVSKGRKQVNDDDRFVVAPFNFNTLTQDMKR